VTRLLQCPNCGASLLAAEPIPGQIIVCSQCRQPIEALGGSGDIIDVHAEPLNEEPTSQYTEPEPSEWRPAPVPPEDTPFTQAAYHYQRRYRDDSGCCCGLGCALIFLFLMIFLRGCAALFF